MTVVNVNSPRERKGLLESIVKDFSKRASYYDEQGKFPFENFQQLKEIGYPSFTIPKKYGGAGISLHEWLELQELIAQHDGSTALAIGWHMGIMKQLGETGAWEEEIYQALVEDVIQSGALINNAATEPATGSPTRGGRPETVAKRTENGWIINGRKSFTTLAPILDYFVVSASIEGSEDVGNFLVRRELEGVSIDETWDSIAMKATGSHDLLLNNVQLKAEDYVQKMSKERKPHGWLLHIPAVYLGIAKAAQRYAVEFATSYSPNSTKGTIADFPSVRERIGKMDLLILESSSLLYSIAASWDQASDTERNVMGPDISATKLSVVNKALEIVDLAMRIVGARSLSAKNPLQRYYRDVRAGLHNPPMDDITIMALADRAIKQFI